MSSNEDTSIIYFTYSPEFQKVAAEEYREMENSSLFPNSRRLISDYGKVRQNQRELESK